MEGLVFGLAAEREGCWGLGFFCVLVCVCVLGFQVYGGVRSS